MQASRVTLSNETRLAMINNPLLTSRKAKAKFRINKVLEYIRTKPAGATFGMAELIAAAGYTEKQYGVGWAFINRMARDKKIVIEHTTKFKKQVSIPGDSHTIKSDQLPYGVPKETTEKPQTFETEKPGLVGTVQTLYTVENIVQNAKQFAWERNSDSLRDFIASMQ